MSAAAPSHRPRLDVGVVGAGRVGSVLAAALASAGHHIRAVYAVSDASRRRAETFLPGVPVHGVVDDVVPHAQLLLLAVPDDSLAGLVHGLSARRILANGAFVAHTSGAHGVHVLDPLTADGALPLAIHPIMTFTGTPTDLDRLPGCPFGVTAPAELLAAGQALVVEMGGEPCVVAERSRPAYHAALASGANHLVTLVAAAADLLGRAGVEEPRRVLGPLLGAALDNVLRRGDAALTGPVARGDAGTVAEHLRVLGELAPDLLPAYVAMARLTADRALASGRLDATAASALLDVLATPGARA